MRAEDDFYCILVSRATVRSAVSGTLAVTALVCYVGTTTFLATLGPLGIALALVAAVALLFLVYLADNGGH